MKANNTRPLEMMLSLLFIMIVTLVWIVIAMYMYNIQEQNRVISNQLIIMQQHNKLVHDNAENHNKLVSGQLYDINETLNKFELY